MRSKSLSEHPAEAPQEPATWVGERRDAQHSHPGPEDTDRRGDADTPRVEVSETPDAEATDRGETAEPSVDPGVNVAGAQEIQAGRVIDGRYRVEALLGEGAVGLVYRCRHLVLDKDVAIKVLRPDFARDPELSGRLVLEAKAASAIGNPHIVETVDFGTLLDGTAFFAMEYLDGLPLTKLIEAEVPLTRDDLLHVGAQIAEALEAAHAAEIVHRDLKPDNVFIVSRSGDTRFVKIVDFGIAKLARAESKLTRAGQIYGTPHYMSPEQASGRPTDVRTDVYALGVILFEMATGDVPFDAEEPLGILSQHLNADPPTLVSRAAPRNALLARTEGLDAVIRKCLAKDPENRYASMFELRADLFRIQGGLAPSALQSTPAGTVAGDASRMSNTTRAAFVVAFVATVAAATLGYALYTKHETVVIAAAPVPRNVEPPAAPAAPRTEPLIEPPKAHEADPRKRSVLVVVIPHDAKIRRGKEDLGPMPVTVDVVDGKPVHLAIFRRGYVSRRLMLDGSDDRVVVGLVPERAARGAKARSSKEAEARADEAAARLLESEDLGFTLEPSEPVPPTEENESAAPVPTGEPSTAVEAKTVPPAEAPSEQPDPKTPPSGSPPAEPNAP